MNEKFHCSEYKSLSPEQIQQIIREDESQIFDGTVQIDQQENENEELDDHTVHVDQEDDLEDMDDIYHVVT